MKSKRHVKAPESPLQILARDHNFRKGRLLAIPAWCKALDPDLQAKVRDIVDEQLDRDQYLYESAVMAYKTGNPGGARLPRLNDALAEAQRNKEFNEWRRNAERSGS